MATEIWLNWGSPNLRGRLFGYEGEGGTAIFWGPKERGAGPQKHKYTLS